MMKRSTKIWVAIATIFFGISLFFILTYDFEKKIKVLDCEGIYYAKLWDNSTETLDYNNAEADVGRCLCEKYQKNKSKNYEKEILKLFEKHRFRIIPKSVFENRGIKIDTVVKYRNESFDKMYNM